MKKLLLALALTITFTAHAETWVRVTDSPTEDLRLFADVDSYEAGKFDNGDPYIGALFQYVKDGEPQGAIAYLTDPNSCRFGGKSIGRVKKDGKWVTTETHIWSRDGNRFYDHIGVALCSMMEVRAENDVKQAPTKPAKPAKPAAKTTI